MKIYFYDIPLEIKNCFWLLLRLTSEGLNACGSLSTSIYSNIWKWLNDFDIRQVLGYTASELYIVLEIGLYMSDTWDWETRFVFDHVLAEILQINTMHKLPHRTQVRSNQSNPIKSKLLVLGAVSTTINDQGCQHVTRRFESIRMP